MHAHHHGRRGRPEASASISEIVGWVSGALPSDLYQGAPTVDVDRDEILVVGDIGAPEVPEGLDAAGTAVAEEARITRFREETRDRRMAVARQAEARYDRPISWGATSGATTRRFTTVHAPVGTRLGLDHRRVLDNLVAAGIARHRGEALTWCVDLVRKNEEAWLSRLQESLDRLRQTAADAPNEPDG